MEDDKKTIITQAREEVTNKWCLRCRHHGSYHRLITRDKWKDAGTLITKGRIPWFCEFSISDDKLCSCTDFQPTEHNVS